MRNAWGFTLIELLITASIFSIIILGIYSTFNTGLLSSQRIDSSLKSYQTARRISNRISLDLRNSFIFSPNDTKFIGSSDELSFFTLVAANLSSVVYKFEDGRLLRIYKRNSQSLGEETVVRPRIIAKAIKDITFTYGYPTQDERIYELRSEWGEKDSLPLAVKIKFTLIEKLPQQKEKEIEFSRLIFLPLAG